MLSPKCSVPCVSCLAIYFYEISVSDIISQTPLKLDNVFKVIGTLDRQRQRLHKPCFHVAYQAKIGWHPIWMLSWEQNPFLYASNLQVQKNKQTNKQQKTQNVKTVIPISSKEWGIVSICLLLVVEKILTISCNYFRFIITSLGVLYIRRSRLCRTIAVVCVDRVPPPPWVVQSIVMLPCCKDHGFFLNFFLVYEDTQKKMFFPYTTVFLLWNLGKEIQVNQTKVRNLTFSDCTLYSCFFASHPCPRIH